MNDLYALHPHRNHPSILHTSLAGARTRTRTVPKAVHTCKNQHDPKSSLMGTGAAAACGAWDHLFLLSIPRGRQRGLPSPRGPGSANQVEGLICTKRALLESVPLEDAQRLSWFGEGGQGCSPKREGEPFPFGPLSVPSAACLPPCPGPPALIPPCFLTACDPVGGLRGEPMGWGRWTRTVRSALRLEGSHPASHECGPRHVPDLGHQPLHLSSAKGPLHHAI